MSVQQFSSSLLENAVNEFSKLPGIGRKTALRLVLHLLKQSEHEVEVFGNSFIHLRKEIPMGAGMGGGSADAAYVLKGLNELFDLAVSEEELEELAGKLGSDCPFFIKAEPQIAKGRGENLSPCALTLNGYYLKIVNPGIHIGTREAYAGIEFGVLPKSIKEIVEGPITDWKDLLKNDFETHIFKMHPSLLTLKIQLYTEGAVYAAMSGSGSTMFGIFKHEPTFTHQAYEGFVEKIVQLK